MTLSTDENKQYDKSDDLEMSDFIDQLAPVSHYLSTGCTILDLGIADRLPGGFGAGRIAQIYGDESTAKTVLGAEIIGSAQRQGGKGILDDVEHTWDIDRAKLFGVDCSDSKKWSYEASTSIEDLFDENIARDVSSKLPIPSVRIVDSLSALSSVAEQTQGLGDGTYGTSRAKQLSLAFRKYINKINAAQLALIFIDQTRQNIGVTFGEQTSTSGGRALKFYASTRIRLSFLEKIKNKYNNVIGVKIGWLVRKNKISAPFKEGFFRLLFDYGIDDVGTSIEWLHSYHDILYSEDSEKAKKEITTVQSRRKARQAWRLFDDYKGKSLDAAIAYVEENNLEAKLMKEVERVWRLVYAPIDRKTRVRINDN